MGVTTIHTLAHKALIALLIAKRKSAGLRQEDVAARVRAQKPQWRTRITQQWIADIEGGGRRIDVIEFIALARAIGFDPGKAVSKVAKVRG